MFLTGCSSAFHTISSPDKKIQVFFSMDEQDRPLYALRLAGREILKPSAMGLVRSDASFAEKLTLVNVSKPQVVKDSYDMLLGKKKHCVYEAVRRVFTFKNAGGETMDIIFQVSNDGLAFRYAFGQDSQKTCSVEQEKTSFAFAADTVSWLHPIQPGKSGWQQTQPSYEEHYEMEKPVGRPSPTSQGWSLPALFRTAGAWVLICDSDVNESYCAVRLADDSTGGVYRIAFPHPKEHRGEIDPVSPQIQLPFASPWRVLIVGQALNTIVESTLMTDVATPCRLADCNFVRPGRAAWHWLRYGDDSSEPNTIKKFIDFASQMHWEYVLIDCNWDKNIGYEKMADIVRQASKKNIGIILWYNSNGQWNTAQMTPKNRMDEKAVRRQEFALLQKMGVKGVKIDFFGGDKQATMKLYLDILKDAADFGLMVDCHGSTIPRGWQRTYPNLVSMEAVKGMEYTTFDQRNADLQPLHCCILPFTRNVIGSMDFTPVVFNPAIRNSQLRTTPAFELALSVIFESGIQHFGLVPDEMKLMPDFVKEFLQKVPVAWDQTRFLDGFPGKNVVLARRNTDTWYIAGINGQNNEEKLNVDLSFLHKGKWNGILITDGPDRSFIKKSLGPVNSCVVELKPYGGFVIWLSK
jgi:alpha-glucosidase